MLKKFTAHQLGLYTEVDLNLAVYDACSEIRQELKKDTRRNSEKHTQKGIELLKNAYLVHNRFVGIFPYISKNDLFYWIYAEIPQPKFENRYYNCTLWVIDSEVSSDKQNNQGFLYFEINDAKAIIIDICMHKKRQGIGSFLLMLLEQLVTPFGVKKISGYLSPRDVDNRSVQIAFYSKNGYSVKLTDNNKEGWIKKELV